MISALSMWMILSGQGRALAQPADQPTFCATCGSKGHVQADCPWQEDAERGGVLHARTAAAPRYPDPLPTGADR